MLFTPSVPRSGWYPTDLPGAGIRQPGFKLPIILGAMQSTLEPWATEPDVIMMWAAAVLRFVGFFRSGEITAPNAEGFNPKINLAWGDVAVDSMQSPSLRLKRSKTDQLGQGVDIYVGKTAAQ